MTPLKTTSEELADCLAAIAAHPNSKLFWNLHHEALCEQLSDPVTVRINYILAEKPEHEQACRFRNLRPVVNYTTCVAVREKSNAECVAVREKYDTTCVAVREKYYAECAGVWEKRDAECAAIRNSEWPDNSWNGKSIFEV